MRVKRSDQATFTQRRTSFALDSNPKKTKSLGPNSSVEQNGCDAQIAERRGLVYKSLLNSMRPLRDASWINPFIDIHARVQRFHVPPETLALLHSELLPSFRRSVAALSSASDPLELRQDPCAQLTKILEISKEIDQTFGRFKALISSSPPIKNPHELVNRASTGFRFTRLVWMTQDLMSYLNLCLDASYGVVESASLIQTKRYPSRKSADREVSQPRQALDRRTRWCLDLIDRFISWSSQSDLSMIQDEWQNIIGLLDDALVELMNLINLPPNHLNDDDEDEDSSEELVLRGRQLDLAHSLIPVLKLSRLLLNRFSRTAGPPSSIHKESIVAVISTLKPHQLDELVKNTRKVPSHIDELLIELTDISPDGERDEMELDDDDEDFDEPEASLFRFVTAADHLVECSRATSSLLLNAYGEVESSGYSSAWLRLWIDQFEVASANMFFPCHAKF